MKSKIWIMAVLIMTLGILCLTTLLAAQTKSTVGSRKPLPIQWMSNVTSVDKSLSNLIPPRPRSNSQSIVANVFYYGGPVVSNPQVIAVYWGPNVDSQIVSTIPSFYQDVLSSFYEDGLYEYSTLGVTGHTGHAGSNQAIGRGTFVTGTTITPSNTNTTVTQDDIANELSSQITNGHLQAPQFDATGNASTIYMVYFPSGITISLFGSNSCQIFCAFHYGFQYNGVLVPFGVFPELLSGPCVGGCGSDPTQFNNLTSVSSHELIEAITDTDVSAAINIDFPLAWYDQSNGELGDICNQLAQNIVVGTNTWTVQKYWSVKLNNCTIPTLTPPQITIASSANTGTAVSFTVTVTEQADFGGGYRGTLHFTSSDAQAQLPADYTYTTNDGGTHQFNVTFNTAGTQILTVTDTVAAGITANAGVTVNHVTHASTTALSANPSTPVYGQNVTLTAIVGSTSAGTLTGTVTFTDGNTTLGNASVVSGQASIITTFAVGTHSLSASYSGDSNFDPSASSLLPLSVAKANSQTLVTSSLNPSQAGQSVTFTATVTPIYSGTPTGLVSFYDGATLLTAVPLTGNIATYSTSALTLGSHNITATYSGDTNFNTSSALVQQSVKSITTTALTSSLNPSTYGQQVIFLATVTSNAGTPSGTVQFTSNKQVLATVKLLGGVASFATSNLNAGNTLLLATYAGNTSFQGSSASLLQVVNGAVSTTTSITGATPNPATYGNAVTFTASVTSNNGVPTGIVKFKSGATSLGQATLSNGTATLSTTGAQLAGGADPVTATYVGNGQFSSSISPAFYETVFQTTSSATVSSSANPSSAGQPVTFTATITGAFATPTGKVRFMDGSTVLATIPMTNGVALFTTTTLASGSHTINASYAGDLNYGPSSASVLQTVQ
jgi:hypothetical protein